MYTEAAVMFLTLHNKCYDVTVSIKVVNRQLRSEVKGREEKGLRIQPGFEPRTF